MGTVPQPAEPARYLRACRRKVQPRQPVRTVRKQAALPALLEHEGIDYVHLGDALGGKPADRSLYLPDGAPDYQKMGPKPEFLRGIEELVALAGEHTVALMCAEEDPTGCHRSLLIGPALEGHGGTLSHIRKDGALEAARSA